MKIHTTIGVYANGERKINGVPASDLQAHIEYNIAMRPGRAFFVDGKCLNCGYLSVEEAREIERELKEKPIVMTKDTAPYV